MEVLRILLIVFASILGILIFISFNLARFLVFPIRVRHRWVIGAEEKKGLIVKQWYDELVKEIITLLSPYNYKLYAELVINPKPSDKTVVIVHGYRFNLVGSLKYGKMFLDMGYNVFWYDNCKCGNSSGRKVTMGFREQDDLESVVEYIRARFGEDHKIGIHGESMGAALSIMYGARDNRLSFIIEDCGYSDLREELKYHLKNKIRLPVVPILPIAEFFVKLLAGFAVRDVSPITLLQDNNSLKDIPMLFIHGGNDTFTPTQMVKDMYNAKTGIKDIYIADGANHGQSFKANKDKYIEVVSEFLIKTNFNERK